MTPRIHRWLAPGRTAVLALLVLLPVAPRVTAAENDPALPLQNFFSPPNVRLPRLSPDGRKIAFLFPHEKKMALGLFERETKESRIILRGQDESIARFAWKGNDRIVFEADVAGNESFFIGSTDLSGTTVLRIAESQRIEFNLTGDLSHILSYLPGDPDRIGVAGFFAGNIDSSMFVGGSPVVARLNIRNRALSPLFELRDSDRMHRFLFDRRGVLRLRSRLEGKNLVWEHRDEDRQAFRRVAEHPFHGYEETWDPVRFAAEPHTLWLISRTEHDRGALHAVDTRSFALGAPLFVPPEGEITDVLSTPDDARLLGVRYESDRGHHHWFDADRGRLQARLEGTFTGCDVRLVSTSDDRSVSLVWAGHDREPGVYYVLDQRTNSLTQFRRIKDLNPAALSPRQAISYQARDGLTIHGYLTIPRGREGQRVPLVVHPHGGPFGIRDTWGYDNDAQFLASRGYAVLQPNYRGSGGYGREFLNKGRHQWGRAMQDDLTDGVKWAIAQGIADPERIAIYGASYGGYASLMGVIGTPDLYRCAVNYVGAADLELTFHGRGEDAWRTGDEFRFREEWVGPTRAYRDETSPILLADRIRVPTLHAYGAEDPRVKINHWTRLEPQLKKYGKDYRAIVEGQQGHGFRDVDASLSFYEALDQFLAEHLRKPNVTIGPSKVLDLPAKR